MILKGKVLWSWFSGPFGGSRGWGERAADGEPHGLGTIPSSSCGPCPG